jgi:hypothetical protein
MASRLIVAALLQAALALSPSALTQRQAQKKENFIEVCMNPCASYDSVAGVDEDTEIVCVDGSNYCKSASTNCNTIGGFVECQQKVANVCEHLCSAWTGSATSNTKNICQTHVLADEHNQQRDHYSCGHVEEGGCGTGTNECRQQTMPPCLSECGNMRSNGADYPYPDSYLGSASSGINQSTVEVCQNNFPETAQIDWMGYCLKMPCDYHQHNSLGWNGSEPCRQYFNYCDNSCAAGSDDPPETAGEIEMVGDVGVPIMCYDAWSSECRNPLADGSCPEPTKFNKKCGRRLKHQDLKNIKHAKDGWVTGGSHRGGSLISKKSKKAEVKPHSEQPHPLMRQESDRKKA